MYVHTTNTSLVILRSKYYSDEQIKNNETDGLHGTCGGDLVGNMGETDHVEDRGVDGNTIFKWILVKYNEDVDCISLAQGRGKLGGFCEQGNAPWESIKCVKFGRLSDYLLLKTNSLQWSWLVG